MFVINTRKGKKIHLHLVDNAFPMTSPLRLYFKFSSCIYVIINVYFDSFLRSACRRILPERFRHLRLELQRCPYPYSVNMIRPVARWAEKMARPHVHLILPVPQPLIPCCSHRTITIQFQSFVLFQTPINSRL